MTKAELAEILNSYHWIKIKAFKPENYSTWEEKYQALEQHHLAETEFLIAKIRELAQKNYEIENL
jgi:hypothetical protein